MLASSHKFWHCIARNQYGNSLICIYFITQYILHTSMDTKPKLTAAASTVQLIDLTSHRLVIKSRQQQKNTHSLTK